MKLILLTLLFIIGLIILPAVLSLGIVQLPLNKQPGLSGEVKIYDKVEITESLVCPDKEISAIGASFRNFGLSNKNIIKLTISDAEGNILSAAKLNGLYIQDGAFSKFKLEKRLNCSGDTVYLKLSSPDSASDNALEVLLSDQAIGDFNSVIINQNTNDKPQSIALVLFSPITDRFDLITQIYTGFFSKFFSDKGFAVSYLILVSGLLVLGVYHYRKIKD